MLVQINTQVGGVSTDQQTRWFNFMCSLHAVATAAAGSTPVVNPVNTSAVKNTSYNCITVLSNAEAGGWSTGAGNTITASTTYNASAGTPYSIDLYNLTGKTTYPYYRIGFRNPYAFSTGQFTSYPIIQSWCGHSATDPTGATPPWSDSTITGSGSGMNTNAINGYSSYYTSYPSCSYPRVDKDFAALTTYSQNSQPIYVASTSGYLIIMTPFDIWYFGTRTVSPWELSRTDNPPWVSFGWAFNGNESPGYWNSGSYAMGSHYHAFASLTSADNSVTSTPRRLGYGGMMSSGTAYGHNFTGYTGVNSPNPNPNATPNGGLSAATHALLNYNANVHATTISLSYACRPDNMITDVTTGQQVPPAYPLLVNGAQDVGSGNPATTIQTVQGVIKGILRGPSQSPAGLNAMLTASDYVIGSSTYIPVKIGCGGAGPYDCFFIRKA